MTNKYYFLKIKPRKCPLCGSKKVAEILWGSPVESEDLNKKIEEGRLFWEDVKLRIVIPHGYALNARLKYTGKNSKGRLKRWKKERNRNWVNR